ncbi:unnamed protein product [marine sediment metagenome]|uniref:DNA primase/polymerase bifunctional N-terminal domain-containing protein n=1 Tax=marine sediment metagenome TaxID=412755 RepID=X1QHY7_9ZZZZ
MAIKKFIQEYFDRGFSLIPLKNNSKVPAIRWKKYQYTKASLKEIEKWFITFDDPNIALITGLKLVAIDADDPSKLPELFKRLPEAEKTTRVKTKRPGYHFYFSNDGHKIRSTKNLFGLGIELKANGNYVVAPPSKIDNFTYQFLIPLSQIKPLPEKIIKYLEGTLPGIETGIKEGGQVPDGVEYKRKKALSLPRYSGLKVSCIKQILDRDLRSNKERNESLFILYNLLIQNNNKKEYARSYIVLKNKKISRPLSDEEIKSISEKSYNYKCSTIRDRLPYIKCEECEFRFKGGRLGMKNILVKNIRKLSGLDTKEKAILLLLGTHFEGETPQLSELVKYSKMDQRIVKEAIKGLKKKGFKVDIKIRGKAK